VQIDQTELLEKALIGYSHQKQQVEEKMAAIRAQLGEKKKVFPTLPQELREPEQPKKRTMSRSARKRIADAQKKRWAEYHERKTAAA